MTIWPIPDHGDECVSLSSKYSSLFTPPNSCSFVLESRPISPRLEVGNFDAVPFSQNFADLFEDLGLHAASVNSQKWQIPAHRSPDTSYDIESHTNVKEIDPAWKRDGIEEILIISPKRPGGLPTIHEDVGEVSMSMTIGDKPTAVLSDFEIEELDQAGSRVDLSGNTKTCKRRDDKSGKKYLIKRRRARKDSGSVERIILETLTSRSLPFVECLHWAFQNGEYGYLVIDYHPGITLADLIAHHGSLESHRAMFYASELVSAISSLHDSGIVHRDIQPQTIVLDAQGHIVLTNFTHAETLPGRRSGSSEGSIAWNLGDSGTFKMNEYRAPELYLGWRHDGAVDCWSFGMVLYYMFFLRHPYGGPESEQDDRWFYDRVVGFAIPTEALRLVHPMARDLILKCLERNASMRWTMHKIKTHGYFVQVDWDQVSAKRLDVPSFGGLSLELDRTTVLPEAQKRISINPLLLDNERQLSLNLTSALCRTELLRELPESKSGPKASAPVLPKVLKPIANISIPAIIPEENESTSISASTGHPCEEHQQVPREEALDPTERMSRFWADIDRDEGGTATSTISLEFGESNGLHYTKAPKLRKHRSAIQTTHRLFSLSTSSFHNKLRRKPRSTSALRQPIVAQKPAEPIDGLLNGVHQIGSGIGFTYNMPAAVPSKASVCSFVTPTCTHLFHGRFSRRGPSGRRPAKVKTETLEDDVINIIVSSASVSAVNETSQAVDDGPDAVMQEQETGARMGSRVREEVGNGTFIREMYRAPSWILSPPDNLPSPLALVNSNTGTATSVSSTGSPAETELLTPATLVDCPEDYDGDEVTISIPKGLQIELDADLSELARGPDSTLRLVPPVPPEMRFSYDGESRSGGVGHDQSMFSEEESSVIVADA